MYPFYIPATQYPKFIQNYEISENTEYLNLIKEKGYAVEFYSFLSSNMDRICQNINYRFLDIYFTELSRTIYQVRLESTSQDIRLKIEEQLRRLIEKIKELEYPANDPEGSPSTILASITIFKNYVLIKLQNILIKSINEEIEEIFAKENDTVPEPNIELVIETKPTVTSKLFLLEKYGFLDKIHSDLKATGGDIDRPMSKIIAFIIGEKANTVYSYRRSNITKRPIMNDSSRKHLQSFLKDNKINLNLD